jgi:hypothetical protein
MVSTKEKKRCPKADPKNTQSRTIYYRIMRECQCEDCPAAQREREFIERATKGLRTLAEKVAIEVIQ